MGQRTKKEAVGRRCLWVGGGEKILERIRKGEGLKEEAVFFQDSTVPEVSVCAPCQHLGDTKPIPNGRHDPPTWVAPARGGMGSLEAENLNSPLRVIVSAHELEVAFLGLCFVIYTMG